MLQDKKIESFAKLQQDKKIESFAKLQQDKKIKNVSGKNINKN